jgi:uncharacterized protein
MRIGVISDTHDLLRPEALQFLRGSDHIVHAGDICGPQVLHELSKIAPVAAVRGNNDRGDWARELPVTQRLQFAGVAVLVIHDLKELRDDAAAARVRVVVSGHSHRPRCEEKGGVLYFNPGSAGPRRFKLPIGVGELIVEGGHVVPRLAEL